MMTAAYLRDMPQILKALEKYIPQLAGVTSGVNMQNLGQLLQTELGYNKQQFNTALNQRTREEAANQALYPEIGNSRVATGRALQDMLNPSLSGSELSNIERGLNRQYLGQGTFNVPNNLQQLDAAATYGAAGRARQAEGLQLAPGAMQSMTSSVAPNRFQQKSISEAFAKTGDDTGKMLYSNPTETAGQAYTSYMGNQQTKQSSAGNSKDIDI